MSFSFTLRCTYVVNSPRKTPNWCIAAGRFELVGVRCRMAGMGPVPITLALIVMVISGLALFTLLRRWVMSIRYSRGAPGEYEPIVDRDPPPAVRQCASVVVVGYAGLLWAVGHLTAAALWCVTGLGTGHSSTSAMVVVYFCSAAITTSIGSAMLLARQPYGRRIISFGQFLFVLGATMGAAICLMLPMIDSLAKQTRDMAPLLTGIMLSHLAAGTLIGYAAQRVGRPTGPTEDSPEAQG